MQLLFKPFWQPKKSLFAHFLRFCAVLTKRHALQPAVAWSMAAILVLSLGVGCSSVEKNLRAAEAAWAIGEYETAATYYKKAYQRLPASEKARRGEVSFRMAECYRRYGNSARALGSYKAAERYAFTDTTTLLRKGQMLLLQGDYKAARPAFVAYLEMINERDTFASPDPRLAALRMQALRGIASAEEGPDIKRKGSPYTVKMAQQFNSNRSDYCPVLLGTLDDKDVQLYVTSNRNAATGSTLSGITGQKPCDLFVAKRDERGKWRQLELVEGGVNTDYDEGAAAFSPDGKTMYYTVCTTNPEFPRMAEIYTSQRADASWGKPSALKLTGDTLSSYAHPAISPDGQWLYFTSDMPGGYGGTDLWRAQMTGGKVGFIENLGPEINSDGNECFPAFRPTGELYYSSDGLGGMGGLDLYRATQDSVTRNWTVIPLPAPMNSHADDFGITFDGLHNRGFFSSSRSTGGRGWDKIYEFSHPEVLVTAKGWVYEQDGYALPEASVHLVGSDGTNQKLVLNNEGTFHIPVKEGVDYLFLATCKGYLNYATQLHADTLDYEYTYELDFPLPSLSTPVLVRNVFYAFDSADLTAASSDALDRLGRLLLDNPNITIELASHCDYRGPDTYNLDLSQRRAERVVQYLVDYGVEPARLTARGYGARQPKVVSPKLVESYNFLTSGDSLTASYIQGVDSLTQRPRFSIEEQEICNALNRRTEFRVMRTTYGLFTADGELRPDAVIPTSPIDLSEFSEEALPAPAPSTMTIPVWEEDEEDSDYDEAEEGKKDDDDDDDYEYVE